MRIFSRSIVALILFIGLFSCSNNTNTESKMKENTIMEVTTFRVKADVDAATFAKRDAQIEHDFTSKQPGFIKRQSGVDEQGNYLVIVYWETTSDADASMTKFMSDASVADYAQMIDGPTMAMARYAMNDSFEAAGSQFVEVMSFDLVPATNLTVFDAINQRVETDFTGKRKGFLQRLTGVNEAGKQVVAVYWTNKADSDASLEPFMAAPIAQEFMSNMDQNSIVMGRYQLLNTTSSK